MVTKKDRRHSGYKTPRATVPIKKLEENHLFLDDIYDEWDNYRDGFRDWFRDFKKIKRLTSRWKNDGLVDKRKAMNKKQKLLLKIRKARKT